MGFVISSQQASSSRAPIVNTSPKFPIGDWALPDHPVLVVHDGGQLTLAAVVKRRRAAVVLARGEAALAQLRQATKMDKLKRMARESTVAAAVDRLSIDEDQVLSFSSKTGEGREELLTALDDLIGVDENGPDEIGP